MQPLKLTLRNFIGVKAGMDLDEITIDFTKYNGRLILIKGENGKGKSTIMENMHPYRVMPSRATGYTPKQFSYYTEVYGDALKILVWEHQGVTYKSTLSMKVDMKTPKTEAYLQKLDNGSWKAYEITSGKHAGISSTGKASTYDLCVEDVMGSPQFFFTSVFGCQGKKNLGDYKASEIKTLLSEFMGLDNILELGQKAKDQNKEIVAKINAAKEELSKMNPDEELEKIDALIKDKKSIHQRNLDLIDQMRKEHVTLNQEYATLQAKDSGVSVADIERAKQAVEAARKRHDDTEREIGAIKTKHTERLEYREGKFSKDMTRLQSTAADMQKEIDENTEILSRKNEIYEAKAKVMNAVNKGKELRENEKELVELQKAWRSQQDKKKEKTAMINVCLEREKAIEDKIQKLSNQSKLVTEVPCSDNQGYVDTCPLLSLARGASVEKAGEQSALDAVLAEHHKVEEEVKLIELEIENIGFNDKKLVETRKDIDKLLKEHDEYKSVADLETKLEYAETNSSKLRIQIQDIKSEISDKEQAYETELQKEKVEFEEAMLNLQSKLQDYNHELVTAKERYSNLKSQENGSADAIKKIKASIEQTHEKISEREKVNMEIASSISRYDLERGRLLADHDRRDELRGKLEEYDDDSRKWSLLGKALSANGIIALAIDDAGPAISALANMLLLECYGPRFTVSIETQSESKEGNLTENFIIMVYDGVLNEKAELSKKSGGQQIWINEAVIRAIALFQNEQSQQKFETLFSDETDGALDPEKKRMFLAMKEKVMEKGGYTREYFITHTKDIWERADDIIDLEQLRKEQAC